MNITSLPVFPASAGFLPLLLLLKVTIVLSVGGLVTVLLRRRSAAARHLVWLAALGGALALVPLARVAPRLPVRLPAGVERAVPRLVLVAPAPVPGAEVETAIPVTAETRVLRQPASRAAERTAPPLAALPGLVWLAGMLGVLLWSAFGHLGLWGLVRSSIPVERRAWVSHYGVEPATTGPVARVRLALSSVVGTPLTWGWIRPIVLLPSRSSAWPLERRRAALLHELAHVRRGDYVAQLVATLACAAYWFHPLVWWGAARLRSESEHACDDRVLATGAPAPAYASDLLAVAHGARGSGGSRLVAIGMARRSHLEGRLLAVLDETRARGTVRGRACAAMLAGTLLLLVPFAGLELRTLEASASASETRMTTTSESMSSTTRTAETKQQVTQKGAKPGDKDARPDEGDEPGHTMENTLPASPGGTLILDLETGGLVDIHSWDRREVSVHVKLGGSDWQHTDVSIGPERGGVAVHAVHTGSRSSYSTGHRFEIKVPSKYDVRLRSAGGGVTIVGVEGRFEGSTGGGELVIQNARGRASLSTGGGDIEVSDSELEGSVMTGGGTVKLSRVSGGLHGSSGSGPVIYSKADSAEADGDATGDLTNLVVDGKQGHIQVGAQPVGFLHITRAGGTVDLNEVPQGGEIRTGGGEIRIRKGSGSIEARTGGGDIDIGPIAGSVSASTGAGEVSIQLASVGGRGQNVEVWSGTGNVVVDLPADLNARFEVETAYTESHARPTRITSAWSLERAPVTDWDASEGTPRRHVRAAGTAGRGEGLIRIKTVNGDVELRRAGAKGSTK